MNWRVSRFLGLLAIGALIVSGCERWKWNTYATMSDAASEIAQGWMPDKLPPSTRDIRVSHHLDTGQAEGSFAFDPRDWSFFSAGRLTTLPPGVSAKSPRLKLKEEGFLFCNYANKGYSGLLAVHPDGRGYFWTPEWD